MRCRAEVGLLALLLTAIPLPAGAQRLPVRTYTTADGLPNNHIQRIVPDSRGFIWFCTREGLSRYDGYGFTNYGLDHGTFRVLTAPASGSISCRDRHSMAMRRR